MIPYLGPQHHSPCGGTTPTAYSTRHVQYGTRLFPAWYHPVAPTVFPLAYALTSVGEIM